MSVARSRKRPFLAAIVAACAVAVVVSGMHNAARVAAQVGNLPPPPTSAPRSAAELQGSLAPSVSSLRAPSAVTRHAAEFASALSDDTDAPLTGASGARTASTTAGPSCSTSLGITPSGQASTPDLHYGGATTCTGDPPMARLASDSALRKIAGGTPAEPPVS